MTPGAAPSPYNPHTPGAGLDQPTASQSEWQTTDIEVRIRDTHDDAGLSGQTGVIRGISVSWLFSFLFYKESSSVIRNIENRALRWCGHID
jgi:transcription elongation factor SPT5